MFDPEHRRPQSNGVGFAAGRIDFPMAASVFPGEVYTAPKTGTDESWPRLLYWNEVDCGSLIVTGQVQNRPQLGPAFYSA